MPFRYELREKLIDPLTESKKRKMDATHLHLLLNHFPIVGSLLGVGVMLYGYLTSSEQVKKAALWLWAAMALIAIPVFLTGEPAEESVEHLAGVSESLIHEHEEAAEVAIWLMEALGLLSILSLVFSRVKPNSAKTVYLFSALLSVAAFAAMARTGYLGGQIRHTEIRTGAVTVSEESKTAIDKQEVSGAEVNGEDGEQEEED